MIDDPKFDPTAEALRASLRAHARQAPTGELLAEQIIHAAVAEPPAHPRRVRGWRTWALPLVAAGAVGAVVAAVAAVQSYHPSANPAGTAGSQRPLTSAAPHSSTSTPAPTHAVAAAPTETGLRSVRILDLTFDATDEGWALGSAACVHGSGRCTALFRTTDGRTWQDMPGAQFNVSGVGHCAAPCVQHLRFANDKTGYAYGPDAFFMTTDAGRSWVKQPGGAILLESLDSNVIRVTSSGSGCPGPCDIRVSTAALGSTQWTAADLPSLSGGNVALSRGGPNAYLLVTRNPAGGAQDATSTLYRSTDDGGHWTASGEPCPQNASEVDSSAVTAGGAGRVAVLCSDRSAQHRSFVATSTDAGAHFAARAGSLPAATANLLTGDPATVLVAADNGLARSVDGGASWSIVAAPTGKVSFVGFESPTVGRVIAGDARTIWTTRDGGASWSAARFG